MLVSFVISSQGKEDKILKTIASIKEQTVPNYEIILINDDPSISKEAHDSLKELFYTNEHLVLVNNSKSQGSAFNWNIGISLAQGQYLIFVKEGDVLNPGFVAAIKQVNESDPTPVDILQFQRKLVGLYEVENTTSLLEPNKYYILPADKEVYAYVDSGIYNKAFRTDYLRDFRIEFKLGVRYDVLFLYKALGHARSFYNLDQNLLTNTISVLKYSVFDLANQWPHILNYYRRIGLYKDVKDEITYAQFYNLYQNFLGLIQHFDNKPLYKKALIFIQEKYEDRINMFVRNNTVFKENKNPQFNRDLEDFSTYIKTELRKNR